MRESSKHLKSLKASSSFSSRLTLTFGIVWRRKGGFAAPPLPLFPSFQDLWTIAGYDGRLECGGLCLSPSPCTSNLQHLAFLPLSSPLSRIWPPSCSPPAPSLALWLLRVCRRAGRVVRRLFVLHALSRVRERGRDDFRRMSTRQEQE